MNAIEDLNLSKQPGLPRVLVKPKEYQFESPLGLWLVLLPTAAFSFYTSLESFLSTGSIWGAVFILVILISLLHLWHSMKQRKQRAVFLETYEFPSAIKDEVATRYPHLSDEQLGLVTQGLRQYFQLCDAAGEQMVSMPSRVVDVAWHAFILSTHLYAEFCKYGLGRFLHHTRSEDLKESKPIAQGLKVAWLHACKWEEIDQKSPSRLPFLFALDTSLAIPDGFKHSLNNDYATEGNDAGAGGGCGGGCGGSC